MKIKQGQLFQNRQEIGNIFGGDLRKGIVKSSKYPALLLFTNEEEIYTDYFYPKGTYDFCMYTGIGRYGHQDNLENNMYELNIEVLTHTLTNKHLLIFEKKNKYYYFIGDYQLTETHQNVQPDELNNLRRVFVFHLKKVADSINFK